MKEYEDVQIAMGWRGGPKGPSTTRGRFYPYKGVLVCGNCGMNITASTKEKKLANGSKAYYVYYNCTRKHKKITCKDPQIAGGPLDLKVTEKVSEFSITKSEGKECIGFINDLYESYIASKNQFKPQWIQDRSKAQKAMDVLDEKLESGTIDDERYKRRIQEHKAVVVRTTELLNDNNTNAVRWLELATETFSSAVNVGEIFAEANDMEKHKIMNYLGSNWTLSMKKVELTPKRPFDLLHSSSRNLDWRARPDSNRRSSP